ncbi:MAG: DUF2304 domain-containing protein [Candidatus Competibacter sp.]|nr:DUF2304 domain-containing protein [Candidatus Competibacter sp.]MDG4582721.1 DUF2304 domain-containing protein [Candidatus Competibacter sp.]
MITYQITSMAIGVGLAAIILFLVRRDHLHGPYALWWIGAAATVALLGLFPRLFDVLANKMGVSYPPILAIVLGFGLLLLKMLTMDLDRSRQERLIRRLAQRLAMLEARESPSPSQALPPPGATEKIASTDPTALDLVATAPRRGRDRE